VMRFKWRRFTPMTNWLTSSPKVWPPSSSQDWLPI